MVETNKKFILITFNYSNLWLYISVELHNWALEAFIIANAQRYILICEFIIFFLIFYLIV